MKTFYPQHNMVLEPQSVSEWHVTSSAVLRGLKASYPTRQKFKWGDFRNSPLKTSLLGS